MLLARIYEAFPLVCPVCRVEMRLIAFVTDSVSITRILEHLGEPTRPPAVSPARGPPGGAEVFDQTPVFDPIAPVPEPDYELDQRVTGYRTWPCEGQNDSVEAARQLWS